MHAPPPDLDVPSSVQVVDEVTDDTKADAVIAWVGVVPVHAARAMGKHVNDEGRSGSCSRASDARTGPP